MKILFLLALLSRDTTALEHTALRLPERKSEGSTHVRTRGVMGFRKIGEKNGQFVKLKLKVPGHLNECRLAIWVSSLDYTKTSFYALGWECIN